MDDDAAERQRSEHDAFARRHSPSRRRAPDADPEIGRKAQQADRNAEGHPARDDLCLLPRQDRGIPTRIRARAVSRRAYPRLSAQAVVSKA